MERFPKPIVCVSKCLGFEHCRYDGQIIKSELVSALAPFVKFRPVCPEMEIGLGVPRQPIRILEIDGQRRLYQPATGLDLTQKMETFVARFLSENADADGFLLKSRSPSCGLADVKIYPGFENVPRTLSGSGFFGGEVLKRFAGLPLEDDARFQNVTIQEHFLANLFASARFREMKRRALTGTYMI